MPAAYLLNTKAAYTEVGFLWALNNGPDLAMLTKVKSLPVTVHTALPIPKSG